MHSAAMALLWPGTTLPGHPLVPSKMMEGGQPPKGGWGVGPVETMASGRAQSFVAWFDDGNIVVKPGGDDRAEDAFVYGYVFLKLARDGDGAVGGFHVETLRLHRIATLLGVDTTGVRKHVRVGSDALDVPALSRLQEEIRARGAVRVIDATAQLCLEEDDVVADLGLVPGEGPNRFSKAYYVSQLVGMYCSAVTRVPVTK